MEQPVGFETITPCADPVLSMLSHHGSDVAELKHATCKGIQHNIDRDKLLHLHAHTAWPHANGLTCCAAFHHLAAHEPPAAA